MTKILENLINKLYNEDNNAPFIDDELLQELGCSEEILDKLLFTASLHKNYIEASDYTVKLTQKGISYFDDKKKTSNTKNDFAY